MQEQIVEAVRQALAERDNLLELEQMRAAFSQCQEELVGAQHELATVRQTLMIYQETAALRAKQHQTLEKKLGEQDLHIQELAAEVAMLQSALMNRATDEGYG